MRPSSSRLRRMSFWPRPARRCRRWCKRPVRCRSFSCRFPTRPAQAFVASLARPGGNATGFTQFEFGLSGKWLELLKAIAPSVTRAAILRDPADPAGIGQFGAIQMTAPPFGIEPRPIDVRDPGEIKSGIAAFAMLADVG